MTNGVLSALMALPLVLPAAQPASAQTAGSPLDSISAFADAFFEREMSHRRIPGAVLVVVRGGDVILSRGYGYADLARRIPVDPDRTLFRIGSVTKLLTATAAMQLVERGRLMLHADVNAYSGDLRIEPAFGAPITLHHLLTHTAGFEERLIGVAARDTTALGTMSQILEGDMPARVRPPGAAVSYSNHGSTLVGQLIEQASGMPFHAYVRRHVQEPLGMQRSGFRPPAHLLDDMATGYEIVGDTLRPIPPDVVRLEPAGGFWSTGHDMARFLLAHLGQGATADGRILAPETVKAMHRAHAGYPGVATFAYGFYENMLAAQPMLMHTGGWRDFRSLLFLLPEADIGVFLSYNRADEGPVEMQQAFMTQFVGRFVGRAPTSPGDAPAGVRGDGNLAGHLRYIRRAHTTPEKVLALVGRYVHVARAGGDTLVARGLGPRPVTLAPASGRRYQRADGLGHVAFEGTGRSGATRMIAGPDLPLVFERIGWWETMLAQFVFIATMLILFGSAVVRSLYRSIAASARRLRARTAITVSERLTTVAWGVVTVGSFLNLVFLVAFPVAFMGATVGGIPEFVYGMPRSAEWLLVLPLLSVPVAVAALCLTIGAWWRRAGSTAERVHLACVTLMLVLFVPFAYYWRFLAGSSG